MEQSVTETSAQKTQTTENHANERIHHPQHDECLKSRIHIFIFVYLFLFVQTRVSNLPQHVFSTACDSQFVILTKYKSVPRFLVMTCRSYMCEYNYE
jgi:hypothetical protein